MDQLAYISARGMREIMLQQAVNSHNLANASTPGFRASLMQAETNYVVGEGFDTRAFSSVSKIDVDLTPGPMQATGHDLDVAISGEGWMAILGPNGGEALTRRGDLRIDEAGQLINGAGQQVLGDAGPITLPPYQSLSIGSDGTVSFVPVGEQPNAVAVLDRIKLVNPAVESLEKSEEGLIVSNGGLPSDPDANVLLVTGSLEGSNVSTVSAMVEMIELARQFESEVNMLESAEEIDSDSIRLMRVE
jgi:flagellar basal-body rod protein FlgF